MQDFSDYDYFQKNFHSEKTQLVWKWIPADLETPVSAYLKLAADKPNSFLLESVEGGSVLGRYSAIGMNPDRIWKCIDKQVYVDGHAVSDSPVNSLRNELKLCKIDVVEENMPPMSSSGLFGYLGYDSVSWVESIPQTGKDDLNIPDSIMFRPTAMVIFDNVKNMMCISIPVLMHQGNSKSKAEEIFVRTQSSIKEVINALSQSVPAQILASKSKLKLPSPIYSNSTKDEYIEKVEKAKEYIRSGDIFQVVLSQRFSTDFDIPPFELYRSLRRLNPSPFLFYFNLDGFSLAGSSPEILVRLRQNVVTIRPIAGTRKRGSNKQEDEDLAKELLQDHKECAEHLMLLDLGRNDIGRVAKSGSVKVTDKFFIEYYSHVMHIVSNVEGYLQDGLDSLDALFAGFPAGTVSGAPKIRAMEIIDELETTKRASYAGCVGYMDGNGGLDTCIALRTALIKQGKVYVQAGAGVVADSNPASEYQECWNKAGAVFSAVEESIKTHSS